MKVKLTSRKFWVSVAAFLASIGAAISGAATDNAFVESVGIVCAVASAAIYAIIEGICDKAGIENETGTETKTDTGAEA